ncbi:MAG: SpoIIE family protein phosphatase, partial [Bacteroidales bacterium]|nr:SpoIIE family protein phosphatase [Bacteroidales bacterium]
SELTEATMRTQLAEMERELAETQKRVANYELAEISKAYEGLDSTNRILLESKSKAELIIDAHEANKKIAEMEKRKVEDRLKIERIKTRVLIVGLLMTLAGIIVIVYFFWQKRKDNLKLALQRDQIDEQRREIMDSIIYAQRIQFAILPDLSLREEILFDHFIFFLPRDIVSGDYYWATRRGNKSVVVAADCTGHGVPGAFLSILGITFLNDIVLKLGIETASEILDELRNRIKFIMSKAEKARDGMDISLCIIDYETMELQFAGAYNSLYLIRGGKLIEYKADKMPVGVHLFDFEKNFTNRIIPLQRDDMLYIFTDGFFDQFGGEKNAKFKSRPFKQLLTNISTFPINQQKEILIKTHENWKGDGFQVDDILVIGIHINENETLKNMDYLPVQNLS